jgi:multidrug efflux pump subunit AcrA (membrane-fusion protein)
VPASAVQTDAGVSRVFVVKNERAEQRFVQLGREVSGQVEVLRGLKPDERVITGPPDTLVDGSAVRGQGGN